MSIRRNQASGRRIREIDCSSISLPGPPRDPDARSTFRQAGVVGNRHLGALETNEGMVRTGRAWGPPQSELHALDPGRSPSNSDAAFRVVDFLSPWAAISAEHDTGMARD